MTKDVEVEIEKGRERDPVTELGIQVGALCEQHEKTDPLTGGFFFMAGNNNGFTMTGSISPAKLVRLLTNAARHNDVVAQAIATIQSAH